MNQLQPKKKLAVLTSAEAHTFDLLWADCMNNSDEDGNDDLFANEACEEAWFKLVDIFPRLAHYDGALPHEEIA